MKINAINSYAYSNHNVQKNKQHFYIKNDSNALAFNGGKADKIAKAGSATIGGLALGFIGFCVGGPIGAAIAASIGAGAGAAAQDCENDSMNEGDSSHYFDPEDERSKL